MTKQHENNEFLIDFALITAVQKEREAVCRAFDLTDKNRVKKDSRVYWRGRLSLTSGSFYEIVVVQSSDVANVDSTLATYDALNHWSPGAVLLVGFAGAANDGTESDDESLGDMIIGSDVYYYERGKDTDEGRVSEPQMFKADTRLSYKKFRTFNVTINLSKSSLKFSN